MTRQQFAQEDQWTYLLLSLALFGGIIVRLYGVWNAHFPINDGGMFLEVIKDIQNNRWFLPTTLTYNQLNIPFVYPPIGFYLVGMIVNWSGISLLTGIQWLPAIISVGTIIVMYFMGQAIFHSQTKAAIAALIFALVPRSYAWIIMGGGVTRAPGLLFFLLTILNTYQLFFYEKTQRIWAVIVFGSLVILTHPDAALQTAAICALFWIFSPKKRKNFKLASLTALAIFLLTSPWWLMILKRHGLAPIQLARQIGESNILGIFSLFLINFAEETYLPLFTLCALLGILINIYRREWLLPCWIMLPFIIFPRSAATFATIPLAFLASLALNDILIPALATVRYEHSEQLEAANDRQKNILAVSKLIIAIFVIYGLTSSFFYSYRMAKDHTLHVSQREAMEWIKNSTPKNIRFLVLSGETNWVADSLKEWFPSLTQRQSVSTIQGKEWLLGAGIFSLSKANENLETICIYSIDLFCLEQWREDTGLDFNYVYLGVANLENLPLAHALADSQEYKLVYSNSETLIFEVLENE